MPRSAPWLSTCRKRSKTTIFSASQFPKWDMDLIYAKTGIRQRHIAAPDECASDLGVAAAEKLFAEHKIDRSTIDFLLFCTQTPDYPLPTTACLIQDRLGLPTSVGALDFNLGCSGFVYGLSLADGLIRSGTARRVLLITAETYSKYIDPTDRSLRTIFGDGAAATLVEASDEPSLGGFVFGTDGSGGNMLLVAEGGARPVQDAIQPRKRRRWPSSLYMDGPELVKFSLDIAPPLIDSVLARAQWTRDQIDMYLIHQATLFMLDHLARAAFARSRTHARGPGRLRQHGLVDDSDPDPRSPPVGPPSAGQADAADGLRRRAVVGGLRVDRNLARIPMNSETETSSQAARFNRWRELAQTRPRRQAAMARRRVGHSPQRR